MEESCPMRLFTTKNSSKRLRTVIVIGFWLAVWQLYSDRLGQAILMVSPVSVAKTLWGMMGDIIFWQAIAGSCGRILWAFLLAAAAGVALAVIACGLYPVRALLSPLMLVMKSIPVASFVLVLLFYVSAKNLAIPAAFIMVLPIIYTGVLQGMDSTDPQLLEMARVFRVPVRRRVFYIYASQVLPFFVSACSVSLGLAWKSGVAAEVIGLPAGSIGERLYRAKIYLLTGELFAWTLVIVLISLVFEYIFRELLRRAVKFMEER